jgi:hypothetical protein
MMRIGSAQELIEQRMLQDREMHVVWVDAHAWKLPVVQRRTGREGIAKVLIALALRLAPSVTIEWVTSAS